MKKIQTSKFRQNCTKILDEVAKGEQYVIQKRDKSYALLSKFNEYDNFTPKFGCFQSFGQVTEDIISSDETWNADYGRL